MSGQGLQHPGLLAFGGKRAEGSRLASVEGPLTSSFLLDEYLK